MLPFHLLANTEGIDLGPCTMPMLTNPTQQLRALFIPHAQSVKPRSITDAAVPSGPTQHRIRTSGLSQIRWENARAMLTTTCCPPSIKLASGQSSAVYYHNQEHQRLQRARALPPELSWIMTNAVNPGCLYLVRHQQLLRYLWLEAPLLPVQGWADYGHAQHIR